MITAHQAATAGRLRARRDVSVTASGEGWVVKDPLSLEYFRIGDRERFLFAELRRPQTVANLTRRYREAFPNERGAGQQVLAFCAAMLDCSLLVSDSPGQAEALPKRSRGRPSGLAALLSPLAIRLPGVDPTWLLDATGWLGRLLFSRFFLALLVLAAIGVGVQLVGRAEEVIAELSRLTNLFEPKYAVTAILALVLTKTWHELGHAIACRRMGAECHEIGVMLLALMPCLYCDVSDAWTLPSRWRRALVAVAGVYFEAILAVAAAAAWLVLEPGPVRVLAMYVVAAASISTLLVNLNPLLRFDGYYVLADLWGVSNLHQASRQTLWRPLTRWVRRDRQPAEPTEGSPLLLAVYGAASTIYGWMILGVILWFVYQGLAAAGFAAAGDGLLVLNLGGVLYGVGRSTVGLVPRGPSKPAWRSLLRLGLLGALLVAALLGVASIPIEQSLLAPCRLESATYADIVARSDGVLAPRVTHGDRVEAGQVLAELEDPAAELRRLELSGREATLVADLRGLRTRSQTDPTLLGEMPRLQTSLSETRLQLTSHQQQTERRLLRAPIAGLVTPPAPRDTRSNDETPDGELPTWVGAPLDEANRGCLLAAGETLCRVIGEGVRAVVLLDQNDSGLLRPGDPVRVVLDREPATVIEGSVQAIALAAAGGELTETERGLERALSGSLDGDAYRVTVELASATPACQPGAIGRARLVTGRETIGGWLRRWVQRLLRFG